jgi:hypothetical protein
MPASHGLVATAAKTAFVSSPDACPFCGSARSALQEIDLGGWMVECLDCHATGPVKDIGHGCGAGMELPPSIWQKLTQECNPAVTLLTATQEQTLFCPILMDAMNSPRT